MECETAQERGVDRQRLLEAALASIRAEAPSVPADCSDPTPLCAGEPDGTRCVYRLAIYDELIRVDLWPRADDGAIVEAQALVTPDLSGSAGPARVSPRRWAVAGAVRCRGESQQRSYGPPIAGPITISRVELTCWNDGESSVALQATGAFRLLPSRSEVRVLTASPDTLAARSTTPITLQTEPIRLLLRIENPIEVRLRAGEAMLAPVAQITTPERRPAR